MVKIIGNGRVFSKPGVEIIECGAVAFEDDTIVKIGTLEEVKAAYPEAEFQDAEGKMIMPGFICGHGHYYGMFSRGMNDPNPKPAAKNFLEVLENLWWRIDRCLEEEDCYLSAITCLINAIKCGTTTVIDHHASPNYIKGSLDTMAKATKDAGIRGSHCYEVTDRNGMEGAVEGIEENIRFMKRLEDHPDPMLGATFGLHAQFTCNDEVLAKCVEEMKKSGLYEKYGFHVHCAEAKSDEEHCQKNYGKSVIARLNDFGVLGPKTVAGHCVHADDEELEIIKKTGTMIVTNPESNMNNGVGVPDVKKIMEKGITLGLGTDGITYDMMQEAKTNYFVHRLVNSDPCYLGYEVQEMMWQNNAKIANTMFSKNVGELKEGAFADIILVDYIPPTPINCWNYLWHMVFGMDTSMVTHTIVGGKTIMADRKILTLDIPKLMEQSRARAPIVWSKLD
eukprot:TRINITY_DN1231_c0_g1_i1.p1 TRINITY_DN1231_c0_g1~~TRINITY_DN1231_c0_g1_i1.p1  ORF type:complete len:450 (-),score=117.83 TRINITY_DN1231_c0_g1_i1:462-1811(-)